VLDMVGVHEAADEHQQFVVGGVYSGSKIDDSAIEIVDVTEAFGGS